MRHPFHRQGHSRRVVLKAVVSVVLLVITVATLPRCGQHAPVADALDSPEALAQAVLDALASRDRNRLLELALSRPEFERLVWPELPAARPERNLPLEYVWGDLKQKSDAGLAVTLARVNGRPMRLVRIEFTGGTTPYDGFVVHRDSRLVVAADDSGTTQQVRLFGSIYEDREGRCKVFSYVVD